MENIQLYNMENNKDKFAKLYEAYKNGAVIERKIYGNWIECEIPMWYHDIEYRIKPISKEEQKESYDDPYSWVNNSMKAENMKTEIFNPQNHYDNSKGSLYKTATDLGLNHWEFDIFKRLVRCRKKNQFEQDLQKIKDTIDIYLKEYEN